MLGWLGSSDLRIVAVIRCVFFGGCQTKQEPACEFERNLLCGES